MIPAEYLNQIVTGDARELAKRIPDESIDLIYTDPPYPEEFLDVWRDMANYAARILKPRGSLITLLGHYQVPFVLKCFENSGLRYHWIGWINHAQKSTSMAFRTVRGGKPFLWFSKGMPVIKWGFVWDTKPAEGASKEWHEWGQASGYAMRDIQSLTVQGDTILDPFTGGGTVPAVCKMLGRNYVAFEIDAATAERARDRVAHTQPPLFVTQPEQLTLA